MTGYHEAEAITSFGIWGSYKINNTIWIELLALGLIFLNAININTIFNRNDFMGKNNFLPALLYVTFLSFFYTFYYLNGVAIAQALLIAVLYQLFKLYQNESGQRPVFNAALIYSVACTFYPVLLLGTPFVFWMIWVIRPFVFRESMLIIVGILLPLLYSGVYTSVFKIRLTLNEFSSAASTNKALDTLVLTSGIFILFLLSFASLFNKISTSLIRQKKLFRIMLLLIVLLICAVTIEFFIFNKLDPISLLIFPFALLLSFAFGIKNQRMLPTFIFYIILVFSVGKFFISHDYLAF